MNWQREAERLEAEGLYRPEDEHDACGVGMVISIDGTPRRDVVELGIAALANVWHRGAVSADGKTGDGAGVHLQIPRAFFADHLASFGDVLEGGAPLGVGMIFLPRKEFSLQEESRLIIETEVLRFGYLIHSWRQVPVDPSALGPIALGSRPEIAQLLILGNAEEDEATFENHLYVIRRRIEKRVRAVAMRDVYVCSLSCRTIIYKGLFEAEYLSVFYPDLNDPRFTSNYLLFHQRFSTNTAPSWQLAQPFRALAHNGEINTLRGNLAWMGSYEASFGDEHLGAFAEDIIPVVPPNLSDTGCLDAVVELFLRCGKSLPLAKLLMIPPAWQHDPECPAAWKALFEYCNILVSPWDGPAAIVAHEGDWVLAGLDRNGLRPQRYMVTDDGLLLLGSETGMVPRGERQIVENGLIGPGEMIAVNLAEGRLYKDGELKNWLSGRHPYGEWLGEIRMLQPGAAEAAPALAPGDLARRQYAAGYTSEEIELILQPMVESGKEPVGSMGDDTPLAVLSAQYRGMHHFFRQHFSQVTNPPIDPLREAWVMSLLTRIGPVKNILGGRTDLSNILQLETPILLTAEYDAVCAQLGPKHAVIDAVFPADGTAGALARGIEVMLASAIASLERGCHTIVLTDEHAGPGQCAIPTILAAAALHSHMTRKALRKQMSLIVRASDVLDVHSLAVLIGVGATAVNPYLAEATIAERHERGLGGKQPLGEAIAQYRHALAAGLLKVMSKLGISVVSSYRGGRNFDAIGLSRSLIAEFFPGLVSRISGIGLRGLEQRILARHLEAWNDDKVMPLPVGGFYKYRNGGELHAYQAEAIHTLQNACASGSKALYRRYTRLLYDQLPSSLRDLMAFRSPEAAVPLEEVEPVEAIRRRFIAPAMSLGALSPEAHEALAIAMNRIGAASNSGEGGEGAERFGGERNSTIKQVASARFGVTMEYLNSASELQIKVAQGAKPGEGGQLPSFKVTAEIARLRHATPGVSLISPPPHHDIYSIEDLAQLIHDLKQANPEAIVSVKLVAQSGIGTIASGVAKAMADKILISGHVGGTGAAGYSSIKHAGTPWEIGLAEANQVLSLNGLRDRVTLQTDGGLKTGRDIVIAALLGAEEFGIGTLSLVAMGCLIVRQCHSNTCPVGICTQDEKLREHFRGTPEKVIQLMDFIAEEVREILARHGFRSLDEIVGRTDLLRQVHHGSSDLDSLDLGPLLTLAQPADSASRICTRQGRTEVRPTLDHALLDDVEAALAGGGSFEHALTIHNTDRTIGTRLSSLLQRHFDPPSLAERQVHLRLSGSAGQSLGAFAVQGLALEVEGDANDYVGKGLSGGLIVVRPPALLAGEDHAIIGNTVLYGATSGRLFAAGRAGERFAVRNSGAIAVVEGCGANGCEYMTGGTVLILGTVGQNFAAGMTGGMAFVLDADGRFAQRVNAESVLVQPLGSAYWAEEARMLLAAHAEHTGSRLARRLLESWVTAASLIRQVCPREMLPFLVHPLNDAERSVSA